MRPQLTAIYQCAQLIKLAAVLPGEYEVITRVLAPGLNWVLRLGNVHDRDDAAELRERVRAARQGVAADGVEHDIDSAAARFPHDGVDAVPPTKVKLTASRWLSEAGFLPTMPASAT